MGSTSFYPEEAPVHTARVGAFAVERHPVTNAQFAEFVDETGYVTVAEQELDPALYPGANPADLVPGALVFRPTSGPVDLRDWRQWWEWRPGACWRHPFGPGQLGSTIGPDHPVVQVAYPDAAAYARWAGRRLPTEAEWEYAAPRRQHRHLCLGRRRDAGRPIDGQHVAGPFPVPKRRRAGLGRDLAGRHLPAERLRAGRHDRQRLGVDDDRVRRTPSAGADRKHVARQAQQPIRPSTRRSRAARTCARRSTATGTARRRGRRSRRTARPRTSVFAASPISPSHCAHRGYGHRRDREIPGDPVGRRLDRQASC